MLQSKLLVLGAVVGIGAAGLGVSHYASAQTAPASSSTKTIVVSHEASSASDPADVQVGSAAAGDSMEQVDTGKKQQTAKLILTRLITR